MLNFGRLVAKWPFVGRACFNVGNAFSTSLSLSLSLSPSFSTSL